MNDAANRWPGGQDAVGAFTPDGRFTLDGAASGPLSGAKLAVKDLFDIAGRVTGCGNPDWARTHAPAERHAEAVIRLLDAGATVIGKTITDELAFSLVGDNAHYGAPINPAAPERITAGSSSGSAAAVAAGAADLALGTDTGGSVRTPASFCGVWGLRTTHGAVSLDGVAALAPSFDTVGWFASDPALFRAASEVMMRREAETDSVSFFMPRDLWDWCDPEIRAVAAKAVERLSGAAAVAEEGALTDFSMPALLDAFRHLQGAEVWAQHRDWIEGEAPDFGPGVRERFAWTATITADQVATAAETAAEFKRSALRSLEGRRVAVFPTAPVDPPRRGEAGAELEEYRRRVLAHNAVAGLTGAPQVTAPVGATAVGPVGLSLLGSPGDDRVLVNLAAEFLA